MPEQIKVVHYILERQIKKGGMAEVWEARHIHLGNRVAVKFLLPEFAGDMELQKRFLDEGSCQAHLHHPNIVRATDFFQVDGRSYLVSDFVDGQDLDAYLGKDVPPLSLQQVHHISWDVLSALDYAHTQGIIHRDVKPANMLLDQSEHVLLTDFGIAKALREDKSRTQTGTSMGTPEYMSPEQIIRPKEVDTRTDIYSFGCVLYAMLSGKPPFSSENSTVFTVQDGHVRQAPPPLVYRNPKIPAAVGAVAMKCLEKDPAQRFQTCNEVMAALDSATSGRAKSEDTIVEKRKPGVQCIEKDENISRSSSARAWKYVAAALALLTIVGAAGYFWMERNHRRDQIAQKDWSHVNIGDAALLDCMDVQPCHDRKALADKLAAVVTWSGVPYDSALFSDCMGLSSCTERKGRAAMLQGVHDWTNVEDKQLLGDCMNYQPCVAQYARLGATHNNKPVAAPSLSCADVAENYPCCTDAPNPASCSACKKKEGLADCIGIYKNLK